MVLSVGMAQRVEEIARAHLPDVEGHAYMQVKVGGMHCNLFGHLKEYIFTLGLFPVDDYSFHVSMKFECTKK